MPVLPWTRRRRDMAPPAEPVESVQSVIADLTELTSRLDNAVDGYRRMKDAEATQRKE